MIYVLDYLHMLMIRAGYFDSKDEAMMWVQQNDPDRYSHYSVVEIPKARPDGDMVIPQDKYKRYGYQS